MVLVKEYHVPVNCTRAEYQIAQLYAVAEASKQETGGGEGVEVLANEPYEDEQGNKGQYTHKVYHLSSKVPALIRVLAPTGALELHEKAWNAFPNCKTVLTNEYMKEGFTLMTESKHFDNDRAEQTNPFNHTADEQAKIEIVLIDIANDPVDKYKPEEDPKLYKSEKSGRGPLEDKWIQTANPMMTCYKKVTVEFKWYGLQTKIENFIHKIMRNLFTSFHRQVFCWTDRWFGLTIQDIRDLEAKTKEELDKKRKEAANESSRYVAGGQEKNTSDLPTNPSK